MKNWSVKLLPSLAPADPSMSFDEAAIWERLANSRRAPLEPDWLGEVYSPSLSIDLRRTLCEKLGMLADRGWPFIARLLQRHGELPDLVMAAGLCHQIEARDWLLDLLERSRDNNSINLMTVQALGCWGAEVPTAVVNQCLQHPGQEHRLAGLKLLEFRSHCLTDSEVLQFCREALDDFREPVAIAAIRVLQRRDGATISARLADLCRVGSDGVAEAAFRALSCIATTDSQKFLLELSQTLQDESRRKLAGQKLNEQFRT